MDTKDIVQSLLGAAALIVAAASARLAIKTLKFNARTKSAEFLLTLHKAFFVEDTYKTVRQTIDDNTEASKTEVARYLREQPPEFTDFLNFFELMTYLSFQRTLKRSQASP